MHASQIHEHEKTPTLASDIEADKPQGADKEAVLPPPKRKKSNAAMTPDTNEEPLIDGHGTRVSMTATTMKSIWYIEIVICVVRAITNGAIK